jgi:oligoendopeptidase F
MQDIGDIKYHLIQQRLFKPHTLSEPEEKIISIKDVNGSSAIAKLYDMITNKYSFNLVIDGKKQQLSRDALMAYARHPEASIREAVYTELYRVYANDDTVLGQVYLNIVRDWATENMALRGFSSPISVRNLANDIPDTVVDTLLKVCQEEAGVFQRYFKLKAKRLGVEKLSRIDLYAPITATESPKIPYEEAVSMVLNCFERFSPTMKAHAQRVFEEDHIDSDIREGKRGGAFCYSVNPKLSPWVLLNYTGEPRQVATLAHELGHSVHSLMAAEHSILTFHSALPLAETASVFSEMLLTDMLLENEKDPALRSDILFETIDNMYATVLRQAFFVQFERDAHRMIAEGKTIDELSEHYMDNLRTQFGDSVEVQEIFRHEWISIPHIYHTPFYCYAYSFGMLLSLALYARFKSQGKDFAPVFERILAHGGAASPEEILTEAGIDMTDAEFWRGGFNAINEKVLSLEEETK